MMEQAGDFLDESGALHDLVADLSETDLERVTAFHDWTVNDVMSHLHVWNRAADLALTDPAGFDAFIGPVKQHLADGGTLRAFERGWLAGLTGPALRDAWHTFCTETAGRFGAADPSMRVKWAGPDMSVRSAISARLMETWAHGQEVYDLLGVIRRNTDRIRNIVVLGVNTYRWTFAVHGETAPLPPPHLRLTAPSGARWTYNEPSETESISGRAEDFCQVVTQVRNVADTALEVRGANASAWMARAQCFAGPPSDPPAPGSRYTGAPGRKLST